MLIRPEDLEVETVDQCPALVASPIRAENYSGFKASALTGPGIKVTHVPTGTVVFAAARGDLTIQEQLARGLEWMDNLLTTRMQVHAARQRRFAGPR